MVSKIKNRTQSCNINGKMSSYKSVTYGVSQASILGPLLFITYMNDLQLAVDNAEITMYVIPVSIEQLTILIV